MPLALAPEAPPLEQLPDGTVRVAGTRVTLDIFMDAYRLGASAAELAEQFDTLTPADVHGTLAYVLRHPAEVEAYLVRREAEAEAIKAVILARQGPQPSREELLARWHAKRDG